MYLKIQHFVIFTTICLLVSCKQDPVTLTKIEGKQLNIDDQFTKNEAIESFVRPYRNRINTILDSALAYAPKKITKSDGLYNNSAGNLLADIVLWAARPIYKSRTGRDIDFVLLNHGGIRSILSAGPVSARHAFEVMPFENSIVVVELSGEDVIEMVTFLVNSERAHPISGLQVVLDKYKKLKFANVNGRPIDVNRNYYIATSDYLVSGGDQMGFFKNNTNITDMDYLIRNAMIDYFKKVDTLAPKVDDRFYIEK